jgi:hypothetical protein
VTARQYIGALVLIAAPFASCSTGCAFTPQTIREYTPAASKFVDVTCVEIRARISDDYHAGKLAGDIALKRMERVNTTCDGAADALDTVDDFTALVEEAKLWDSAK